MINQTFEEFFKRFYVIPTPQQQYLIDNMKQTMMDVRMPRQSGLTHLYALYILYTAFDKPDSSIVYISDKKKSATRMIEHLSNYLYKINVLNLPLIKTKTQDRIIFYNNSIIRTTSSQSAECDIIGVDITHAFLDDIDFYEHSAYDILSSIIPIISKKRGQLIIGSTGENYDN